MNPTKALLLLFMCLASVYCLQLTSHKENHKVSFYNPSHAKISYYGRHYLSHRSQEYVKQVKQDNLEKIQTFNTKNKEALKTVNGDQVKGGESFILGPNKFITFTEEEFSHLFTGLISDDSNPIFGKSHMTQTHANHKLNLNDQKKHSVSQDIFDHMFLSKIDPNLSHETENMETHSKQMSSHNQENPSDDDDDEDWVFENPFELDDHEIDELYGKANSDDSWGWDWKSFDPDYYDTQEDTDQLSDFDTYWKQWDDDHWGFDDEDTVKVGSESPWWDKWLEEAVKNADNPEWWGLDESNATKEQAPKEENKTDGNVEERIFPEYPKDAQEVNWAKIGATTHVKNQGNCGSCWSFSSVGAIESYLLIHGKGTLDLSEQQIVDCQRKQGAKGCDGAIIHKGFQFAFFNGLVTQDKYPYRGVQQDCAQKEGPYKIAEAGLAEGRAQLEQALRKGPVVGQIRSKNLQLYKQGIFSLCDPGRTDHAIVIVGYTKDYWIVRNSWGADWGENGHIRIKKDQNKGNACGIQTIAIYIKPFADPVNPAFS